MRGYPVRMKSLARRLLVPTLLLFGILAAGAVAVGAFTNEDVVAVPAQVVPAQIGTDAGPGFLSDASADAELDAPELVDAGIVDAIDAGDASVDFNPIPTDGPISLLP
jgi:hypothetical protein